MQLDWGAIGTAGLATAAVLLGCVAADCIFVGIRDMRQAERQYDRRIGRLVLLTGLGLLLAGGLLWWAFLAR